MEIISKKRMDQTIGVGRLPAVTARGSISFYTQNQQGALSLYEFDIINNEISVAFTIEHELPHTPTRVYTPPVLTSKGPGIITNDSNGLKVHLGAEERIPLLSGCSCTIYIGK